MASTLDPKRITVDGYEGVPINVWDYGGDGPDVILCHCTGTHGRIWDPLVPELLKHFRVVAPDTRGHGRSGKPDGAKNYVWKKSGADLLAVVDQLELRPEVLAVGHSAGAAQIAYTELHHPGTFTRAVLIDPIIGPPEFFDHPDGSSYLGEVARRRVRQFASIEEARERFAAKPPMSLWTPETLDAYLEFGFDVAADGTATLLCPPEIEGYVYDNGGAVDVYPRLSELKFDKSAHVTADKSNVRAIIETQRAGLSGSKFTEIVDTTHFIPQERPAEVLSIIFSTFS